MTATTTTPGGEPGRKHGGSRRNSIGHEVHKADLLAVRRHARPHRSLRVPYLDGGAAISPLVVRPDLQMLQVQYGGGRERLGARDNRKGSWRATQDTIIARSSAVLAVETKKSPFTAFSTTSPAPVGSHPATPASNSATPAVCRNAADNLNLDFGIAAAVVATAAANAGRAGAPRRSAGQGSG